MPPEVNQAQAQQQQSQQQNQEQLPDWLNDIPDENLRKSVWGKAQKGYMQEKDYTQKSQKREEEYRTWETEKQRLMELEKWYKNQYEPFALQLKPHEQQIVELLGGKARIVPLTQAAAAVQAGNNGTDQYQQHFTGYDLLTPMEQARKMAEFLNTAYIQKGFADTNTAFEKIIGERIQNALKYMEDYANIAIKGLMKFSGNEDQFNRFLQEALKVKYGQIDPLETAYKNVTADGDLKKLQDEWYNKGKADADQAAKNAQQSAPLSGSGRVSIFQRPKAKTAAEIERETRDAMAKAGIPWYGEQ